MPPPAAVASLTLQVPGGAHDVTSLATSPRTMAVPGTTEQLTIFYSGSMVKFDNVPREKSSFDYDLAIQHWGRGDSLCVQAEEVIFFAAKKSPDAGHQHVPQQQQPAYPNKKKRIFCYQAPERDADGLFIHENKADACSQRQHRSPEDGYATIKETNPCSRQIQIVPRADVSLLVKNASLVSFLESRKQRLASAAYTRREKSADEKDIFPTAFPRNKTPLGNTERHSAFTNLKNINGNHDEEALDTELKI
uniref:Protein TIFY n=2 Tax=Oryza nivara TaxID=4536 RepID=A0A0E0GCR3_ORYNI